MDIARSYTENEMRKMVGRDLKIITPSNRGDILKVVGNKHKWHRMMVFYETDIDPIFNKKYGHWACLAIKYPNVYFFDSLGIFPDDELNEIKPLYREVSGQSSRSLGKILYRLSNIGYNIHYNDIKFQEDRSGINTCGRFCALFLTDALIKESNPYGNLLKLLNKYKKPNEKYYDNAIVRYMQAT